MIWLIVNKQLILSKTHLLTFKQGYLKYVTLKYIVDIECFSGIKHSKRVNQGFYQLHFRYYLLDHLLSWS